MDDLPPQTGKKKTVQTSPGRLTTELPATQVPSSIAVPGTSISINTNEHHVNTVSIEQENEANIQMRGRKRPKK